MWNSLSKGTEVHKLQLWFIVIKFSICFCEIFHRICCIPEKSMCKYLKTCWKPFDWILKVLRPNKIEEISFFDIIHCIAYASNRSVFQDFMKIQVNIACNRNGKIPSTLKSKSVIYKLSPLAKIYMNHIMCAICWTKIDIFPSRTSALSSFFDQWFFYFTFMLIVVLHS